MSDLKSINEIYEFFKNGGNNRYNEEVHCKLLIKVMLNPKQGRIGSFCKIAKITDKTFYIWVQQHLLFAEIYFYCKILARETWEQEGYELKDQVYPIGTVNYAFEHWKMMGWTRFGISKNSRIKLNLDPAATPLDHYRQVLIQAADGDFTAAEIKQLMEAVNVGLNTHQAIELQKQIDSLKSDLSIMNMNSNAANTIPDKRA